MRALSSQLSGILLGGPYELGKMSSQPIDDQSWVFSLDGVAVLQAPCGASIPSQTGGRQRARGDLRVLSARSKPRATWQNFAYTSPHFRILAVVEILYILLCRRLPQSRNDIRSRSWSAAIGFPALAAG